MTELRLLNRFLLGQLAPALFALVLCAASVMPVAAQSLLPGVGESAQPQPVDAFGRETPRDLATQLVDAFASGNYARAAEFLQPREVGESPEQRADVALRLQQQLDRSGSLLPFSTLSNDAGGAKSDGLPVNQERIGSFRAQTEEIPLIAQHMEPSDAAAYWVVSAESLQAIVDAQPAAEASSSTDRWLPMALHDLRFAGASVADWMILTVLAVGIFLGVRLVFTLLLRLFHAMARDPATHKGVQFADAAFPPLGLYVAVVGLFVSTQQLQVAIVARQVLARYAGIVGWVALVWFLWRLIDMVSELWSARMARSDRRRALSALVFVRRSAKSVLVMIAFVAVLDTIGIDVTTGIAALGLGGLAIALGAQKTIENLVGSLSVIIDQPVRVGDYCKVGDVTGTVEDIGMRSTQLRTLARTVVTIPNGAFSSKEIENYSRRDRFLMDPTIGLTYDTSSTTMRSVLLAIRKLLNENDNVVAGARVRFASYNQSSLDIEIFAYLRTRDYADFMSLREEILLRIMDTIEAEGASIAFPTQTIVLKRP